MLVPILVLLGGSLALGLIPGAHAAAEHAARRSPTRRRTRRRRSPDTPSSSPPELHVGNWTLAGVLLDLLSAALAVGGAALALYGARLARLRRVAGGGRPALQGLRRVHSGLVTDYVAWLMTGVAVLGGLVGLPLR